MSDQDSTRTGECLFASGREARIIPDGFSENGYVLEINGAEQSHINIADPSYVFYEYLRRIANVIDILAAPGKPLKVAHLGAGALTLVRYIAHTRPGSVQVALDIEPELFDFVTERLPLPAGTNCRTVIADARHGLGQIQDIAEEDGFDAIILDIFTGTGSPKHLATPDYYTELSRLLGKGGVLAINIGDDPALPFFRTQASALLTVFPHLWCLCDSAMLSAQHEGNLVLIGTERELDEDTADALYARGPHPAETLGTDRLRAFLNWLESQPVS